MTQGLQKLNPSLEILGPETTEEVGIHWDPASHFALGVWQIGRGRSSFFGLVTTSEPDLDRIVKIVGMAMSFASIESGNVTVLCGSYWDLSNVRLSLEATGVEVLSELRDRLGGTKLALRTVGIEGLSQVLLTLWGECHSFLAWTDQRMARDLEAMLEELDSENFHLMIEAGTTFAVARHSHPEDFLLFVEREKCGDDLIENLRRVIEA